MCVTITLHLRVAVLLENPVTGSQRVPMLPRDVLLTSTRTVVAALVLFMTA